MNVSIIPPEPLFGRIALLTEVPPEQKQKKIDDVADAYAVELSDEIPGGCVIYGLYGKAWVANVSGRWLLTQFITAARQMAASEFSNRGAWQQACNRVIELVEIKCHD